MGSRKLSNSRKLSVRKIRFLRFLYSRGSVRKLRIVSIAISVKMLLKITLILNWLRIKLCKEIKKKKLFLKW